MSTTVTVGGSSFEVPDVADRGWGQETTDLLIALSNASYLILGGTIPLTSEADFGTNFGLKSIYYKTGTALPAAAGILRLANVDTINWRNGANGADLALGIAADRLQYEAADILQPATTDILTNKTLDAALNTLSNIDTTMWAAGILNTSTTMVGASDLNVPSSLAIKTYVDDSIGAHDDASEITYTPGDVTDWTGSVDPGNVDGALDQLAQRATDHPLDTVTHGATGAVVGTTNTQTLTNKNLDDATTKVVDTADATKAIDFDVGSNQTGIKTTLSTTATGIDRVLTLPDATDTLVGRGTSDAFTNKTIDGDLNILSNLAHGAEVDNPSSGVHGATGDIVGTTDAQVLTNKTIDGDDNTVQDLPDTALKTVLGNANKFFTRDGSGVPLSTAKAVPTGVVVGDNDAQVLSAKTLTSPIINTQATGTALETDLAVSALSTKLATAAAIKTYVDAAGSTVEALESNDDSTEAGNLTIGVGKRRWESDFTILVANTWTVAAGARLVVEDVLTVDGILIANGIVRVF